MESYCNYLMIIVSTAYQQHWSSPKSMLRIDILSDSFLSWVEILRHKSKASNINNYTYLNVKILNNGVSRARWARFLEK